MSSTQMRQGVIVFGEDSESDDEVTYEAEAPKSVARPSRQGASTATTNQKSSTGATLQQQTTSANSSLLHQKLGESKQRLQSHLHSTFVGPLEQQRHLLQQVARGGAAGASLVQAQDTLSRSSAGLRELNSLLATVPRDNLAVLRRPRPIG